MVEGIYTVHSVARRGMGLLQEVGEEEGGREAEEERREEFRYEIDKD